MRLRDLFARTRTSTPRSTPSLEPGPALLGEAASSLPVRTNLELLQILGRVPPAPELSKTAAWSNVILMNDQYEKQLAYAELKERAADLLEDLFELVKLQEYEIHEDGTVTYAEPTGYTYVLFSLADIASMEIQHEGHHLWHKSWRKGNSAEDDRCHATLSKLIKAVYAAAKEQDPAD
jgi:hypothetical protein